MNTEQALKELEKIRQRRREPGYQPITLESLNAQLAAGEITQDYYDRAVFMHQLTPEVIEERIRLTRQAMYKARLRNPNSPVA